MEYAARSKLRMVLDLPFREFNSKLRQSFLADLCHLTGLEITDLTSVDFRSGCVVFDSEVPTVALDKLLELIDMFARHDERLSKEEKKEISAFVRKYRVRIGDIDHGIALKVTRSSLRGKIFLIHGWRGDRDSFGRMPEILEKETGRNVHLYSYPTGLFTQSPPMFFLSRNLDNYVRDQIGAGDPPVAFIAHGMGGLLTRKLLVSQLRQKRRIDELTDLVVFAASPRTGVPFAKLRKFVPFAEQGQLRDLTPDSSSLAELMSDWIYWERDSSVQVRNVYGIKDRVIDIVNMSGDDPDAVPFLDRGHIDIVKPRDENDDVVRAIVRFMRE